MNYRENYSRKQKEMYVISSGWSVLVMGLLGGAVFERFLHDCPMSFASCKAKTHCHANVARLWSSLSKTRGVASVCSRWLVPHLFGGAVFVCPVPRGIGLSQICVPAPPLCHPPSKIPNHKPVCSKTGGIFGCVRDSIWSHSHRFYVFYGPALNIVKSSCVSPCFDQGIGRTTIKA